MMKPNPRKILLVEPPFYRLFKNTYSLARYPLALGYLAGEIKRNTIWNVMVYNADFHPRNESIKVSYLSGIGFNKYLENLTDLSGEIWKEIEQTIAEYNPSIVGISAKSQNFKSARRVAELVKKNNKDTLVIMGGPHPSLVGEDLLDYPEIDICVKNEGEKTIVELLGAIDNQTALHNVNGIVCREEGEVVETPPREFIENLDTLCFPHEHAPEVLKDYEQYPKTAFRSVFATRGCPYNCFFCGSRNVWGRKVRFRSPENVAREIGGLLKLGLKFIHFDDDTFGVNKQYIADLCRALMRYSPGLKWGCEAHPKLMDDQVVALMKAAGCFHIQIGVESGNNEILSAMRKNITIEEALEACKIVKRQGLELQAFFIVGYPQETEETLQDTITAMKNVKCDVLTYSIFTPYPGTEAFEYCMMNGLIGDDYDVALYNHQSPANHFCLNITQGRFRELVSDVEKSVDRKFRAHRLRRLCSLSVFKRIQELGIGASLKRGLDLMAGK